MNIVVVSTYRRPFHTRLCLESLCRAQQWYPWADKIAVCIPSDGDPDVTKAVLEVIGRESSTPFAIWCEPDHITNPHDAAKWMLDNAFSHGAEIALYVEDDAYLSPDAFVMCEFTRRQSHPIIGCCLYHESIPAQYAAEGREPDYTLLNLGNGINTCGGTAFLRAPYLEIFAPQWNLKTQEPRGFDYSLHYLMYMHRLYVVWPDVSRALNLGFTLGAISQPAWAQYFGRSIAVDTAHATCVTGDFHISPTFPPVVLEEWMKPELSARGLL